MEELKAELDGLIQQLKDADEFRPLGVRLSVELKGYVINRNYTPLSNDRYLRRRQHGPRRAIMGENFITDFTDQADLRRLVL